MRTAYLLSVVLLAIAATGTPVCPAQQPSPWTPSDLSHWEGPSEKDKAAYAFSDAGNYVLGSDSLPHPTVPQGRIFKHRLDKSRVYPGVRHDYWVYVPQQYDSRKSACLMVFLDGARYLEKRINTPVVLDNLIDQKQIPVMIGLFVDPGDRGPGLPLWGGTDNRSVEYDSITDSYARFLLEDLIPQLQKEYSLSSDPACRGIAGTSSGGIAAFTVAWQRPDAFRKVISFVGSFTDIRGGNQYPSLIRKTERKPLRVFLQSGAKDLDIIFGNWPLANRDMAAALAYRDYDYQFVFGEGGHSAKHGAAILPDAMRWLWRDEARR
jgi:enterochelin esterase family protein